MNADAYNAEGINHGVRREYREAYNAVIGFSRKGAKNADSDDNFYPVMNAENQVRRLLKASP